MSQLAAPDLVPGRELQEQLLAHVPAAFALFDREMRYLVVSQRYLFEYGITESVIGRSHYEVFPEIPERWREIHQRCLAGAVERGEDDPFPRADGTMDWVDWEIRPIRDASSAITGIVLYSTVVTQHHVERARLDAERKRLAESEDRFRALFEQTSVGMAEVEAPTGRFLRVNERLCQITGRTRDELLAGGWADITHPDDVEGDRAAYRQMLATRQAYTRTKRYVRKDGAVVVVDLSVTPMWAEGEEPRTVVSLAQDATARREAEEALSRSEQRFRALIEKSSDILIVFDERMRVKFWSPSATAQLGWTSEEVLGRNGLELVSRDKHGLAQVDIAAILAKGSESTRLLGRMLHRDGSSRLVEVVVRNLLADPSVEGIVANVHDITEQQQLTEQFQQSQKLESIGRLAGGVAHDFNNLLTVILGCSEALKDDTAAGLSPDVEDIEQIHAAGERARDLTRQLLAFARKQVIVPVTLDLNTVVRGSQKMLARLLGEDVELRVALQPGLWSTTGDLGQIEQVIMNLAVNARDAMPRGGVLLLETRNATVTAAQVVSNPEHRVGEWVQLVVHDSGTGMSPEVLSHVFEPFFTTKEQGKGTGLGLATVYGIVQQAGGHLHVASTVGQGTRFQVCLPRTQRSVSTESRGVATTRRTGHETILVAEDDAQVRVLVVRGLREAGYDVLAAGSGAEALEVAKRESRPIHLLLTDVVMPRGDGRSLADELAHMRPGLRVLFVSGYTDDVISHHGMVQSGVDLLQKPFTAATLLERVRRALDR